MSTASRRSSFVLGSRSPRRIELLRRCVVPAESIEVLPPRSSEELTFDGLHDDDAIRQRLRRIADSKCDDVLAQLEARADCGANVAAVITADTTIIVRDESDKPLVLGQPPEAGDVGVSPLDALPWQDVVREWFERYYFGRTHIAATAVCVARLDDDRRPARSTRMIRVVESRVRMERPGDPSLLDWYLATGEPLGKAGGYGLQGAGGMFVTQVDGSHSNVIGLPIAELRELFARLDRHPAVPQLGS